VAPPEAENTGPEAENTGSEAAKFRTSSCFSQSREKQLELCNDAIARGAALQSLTASTRNRY
jgi:hypothetical protein